MELPLASATCPVRPDVSRMIQCGSVTVASSGPKLHSLGAYCPVAHYDSNGPSHGLDCLLQVSDTHLPLHMEPLDIELPDPAATTALGGRLGSLLFPGSVVALVGPLGAGKTHLVRAVAEGLGIPDSRIVSSPTFVLIHEYCSRLPIYHFDA